MKVTARARRSGDWWAIDVPEVEGVFTQTKRLDQAAEEAAHAVATMLDIRAADVEVVLDVLLPKDVDVVVGNVRTLADDAEKAQRAASAAMRDVVSKLRQAAGLSVRDVGVILGISHQRVAQLESSGGKSMGAKGLSIVQGGKSSGRRSPVARPGTRTAPAKSAAAKSSAASRKSPATKSAAAKSSNPGKSAAAKSSNPGKSAAAKSSARPKSTARSAVTGKYVNKASAASRPKSTKK